MSKTKIKLNKDDSKKIKLITFLFGLLVLMFLSLVFVNQFSKYAETKQSEASGSCGAGGEPIAGGCHYGNDPQHASSGAGSTPRTSNCNTDDSIYMDVSRDNSACNYTHSDVCVQKQWDNTSANCVYSADWECCSSMWNGGKHTDSYIVDSDGSVVLERDYYNDTGIDGRLDKVYCTEIYGWAGTKSDIFEQVDIFFTVGAPFGEGGIVFNPGIKADLPDENGSIICDFLDAKSDGPIHDCQVCKDDACEHLYKVDLSQYPDSPIFNGGEIPNGNRIYAYAVSSFGETQNLLDGPTAKIPYREMEVDCGSGWDGQSDDEPDGSTDPDNGSGGNCDLSADFNVDGVINLDDFSLFKGYYLGCATSPGSSNCNLGDLNCDGDTDISDFGEFKNQFAANN